ncbi:hypothetical protein B0H12DRAFT_1244632 [Mycena haematopus]|nr:hypothetical protein B0H12DRAFT_1244632 [Mycena haematopus]
MAYDGGSHAHNADDWDVDEQEPSALPQRNVSDSPPNHSPKSCNDRTARQKQQLNSVAAAATLSIFSCNSDEWMKMATDNLRNRERVEEDEDINKADDVVDLTALHSLFLSDLVIVEDKEIAPSLADFSFMHSAGGDGVLPRQYPPF